MAHTQACINLIKEYFKDNPDGKLSDDWGKSMCQDSDYLEYLKGAVNYRLTEGI